MLREITIRPVLNGYVVTVGCQALVFGSLRDLLREMETYFNDPNGTEKAYRENGLNAKWTFDRPVEIPPQHIVNPYLGDTLNVPQMR